MTIFSDIISGKIPGYIIYHDDLVTAFLDYFPASFGHTLIVPNEAYENIFEIPEDTLAHLAKVSKRIALALREQFWIEHMNILQNNGALAGQTVFHYHMHLIPRAEWDSIQFWWETDESLREGFDELKERLSEELK